MYPNTYNKSKYLIYYMFAHLTLDGNSEYVAGMKKVGVFREKKSDL